MHSIIRVCNDYKNMIYYILYIYSIMLLVGIMGPLTCRGHSPHMPSYGTGHKRVLHWINSLVSIFHISYDRHEFAARELQSLRYFVYGEPCLTFQFLTCILFREMITLKGGLYL